MAGNVIETLSVPYRFIELLTVNVFPFTTVNVPVELVIVKPLIEVAVAAPNIGVTNVGLVSTTILLPVPV